MNENILIPNHIGIIMDGNGRWAQEKGMIRTMGHKRAVSTLKDLCIHMADMGIKYVSLYAFSTENFKREIKEVEFLMDLFINTFNKEFGFLKEKKCRVVFSGRKEPLPKSVIETSFKITEMTKNNTGGIINFCLNYGGQSEIIDATLKIIDDLENNKISKEDITIDNYSKYLYQDLPMLDFLIRTSGEYRVSNFMLWQLSYAEFYFPEVCFPDFNEEEFDKALLVYNKRDRRFGGINYENKSN
jgi:undecaprenyl diphosphate synthase